MSSSKTKFLTVVGTRPELIRLSQVIPLLDQAFDHRLLHTGQNFDASLNDVFFRELKIREPDHRLNVGGHSLGEALSGVILGVENIISEFNPKGLLILGDTNSALAAIIAKRMGVVVYHMEAGNRSFDINVPEETNRRIVDSISDFNLPYTEHARRNLLAEGHHPRTIALTGSPMAEVLDRYRSEIDASTILGDLNLNSGMYFLVSAHRQENVDDASRLQTLLGSLVRLSEQYGVPCLVSTHPRLLKKIESLGGVEAYPNLNFMTPFGFFDYLSLQKNAMCVLSDSGTVSEEAAILGFPAVTIRDSMERPEALESGSIILTGLEFEEIAAAVAHQRSLTGTPTIPDEYQIRNVSERVVGFIHSTLGRHSYWSGRRA